MRLQSFNTGQGLSMPVKLTTLLLWAMAAAVVVFWTLRFVGSASEQLPSVVPAQPVQANAQAMAKALGRSQRLSPPWPRQWPAAMRCWGCWQGAKQVAVPP
jgi:hypothetical protein